MSTYFAVVGENIELVITELSSIGLNLGKKIRGPLYLVEDESNDPFLEKKMSSCGTIIKRGIIGSLSDLLDGIREERKQLFSVDTNQLGMRLKKQYNVRRFKICELMKSDLEVKKKGSELLTISEKVCGLVRGRQNVDLYTAVDIEKPVRGMSVGMMPSKLARILIAIGIGKTPDGFQSESITVYDPFCGFGTTNYMANALGYNTIGSDINCTPAKQNYKRRQSTSYVHKDKKISFFKQDVLDMKVRPLFDKVDCVVSEGRLGPMVTKANSTHVGRRKHNLPENIDKIIELYTTYFKNSFECLPGIPQVITLPSYLFLNDDPIWERIRSVLDNLECTYSGEILYKRPKQLVGRRILIVTFP